MKSKFARISNWIGILSVCMTALISFAADTPPGCLTPPAGLVAWFAGEGDANDSINSNQGILNGGLGFAPGEVGQAFNFTADGKFVKVPASSSLDVGAGSGFTIDCWINPTDVVNERPVVEWNKGTGNSGAEMLGVHLWISTPAAGGGPGCVFANLLSTERVSHYFGSAAGLVHAGQWQHIALTYEKSSGIALLYLNGAEVARSNLGSFTPLTSYDLYLGWRPGPLPIRSFAGLLDEVGIYNRALPAADLVSIYNAGSAGKCVTPVAASITAQPASQTVLAGADVTFSIKASGTAPLSYQWQFNGANIEGATSPSLALGAVQPAQSGSYSVQVSNALGSVVSSNAQLTVLPALQLFDLSRDFSTNTNPTGVWSYGWKSDFSNFTAYAFYKRELIYLLPPGTWLDVWLRDLGGSSAVVQNSSEANVYTQDGQTEHVPGAVSLWPGANGCVDNFAAVRFTAPNTGTYLVVSAVKNPIVGWHAGDTEYHVLHNAAELFGAFLPINTPGVTNTSGYTNTLNLEAGDTLEFLCGRGANPDFNGAGLIISLTIGLLEASPVPPVITLQPTSRAVLAGANVSFNVTAFGAPPLSYQWLLNGSEISGATSSTLLLNNVQTNQAGNYSVRVRNDYGTIVSSNAELSVTSTVGIYDLSREFSIDANPAGVWSYGWKSNFSGSFTPFTIYIRQFNWLSPYGAYLEQWQRFVNDQSCVSHNSSDVTVYTQNGQGEHLPGTTVLWPGNNGRDDNYAAVRFTAPATGDYYLSAAGANLLVGWQAGDSDFHVVQNGTEIFGEYLPRNQTGVTNAAAYSTSLHLAAGDTLDFLGGRGSDNNFNGAAVKLAVTIRLLSADPVPPTITSQPMGKTVLAGANVTFSVSASGAPPLSYQWLKNGADLPGATAAKLALQHVQPADVGAYSVVVSNQFGSVTSDEAQLVLRELACVTPPAGLVSWWAAESTPNDSADSNNGTLYGGLGYAEGKVGQAFDVNAYGKYVKVPASANLDVGAGAGMTIECWINPNDVVNERPIVEWNKGSGYSGSEMLGVHLWISTPAAGGGPGCVYANVFGVERESHLFGSAAGLVQAGQWQHIALTYDKPSGLGLLYLNGAEVARASLGTFTPQTSYNLYLGWRPGPVPIRSLDGLLDEVGIYNRALAPNEIAALFEADAAGKCVTPMPPSIIFQPASQTVVAGANVTFSVVAGGTPPLSYQWQYNGAELSGATNHSLVLNQVQTNQAGNYTVVVANGLGAITSSVALLTVNLPTAIDPIPGLVSWWAAEGNPNDSVGGNNGIAQGGLSYSAGEVGQAFALNGSDAIIKVPATPALNVGTAPGFTIETWVNPARVTGILPVAEWYDMAQPMFGTHLHIRDDFGAGGLYADAVGNGGSHGLFSAPGIILPNIWQHVAMTYDKSSGLLALYHNGAPVARRIIGSFIPQTSYDLYLGARPGWDGPFYFQGMIDETGLYNRALTSNEIAAIYTASSAGKNQSMPPLITRQPQSQTASAGSDVTFVVSVSGTSPLTYQWQFNGQDISGATESSLTLAQVQVSQAGNYSVRITNAFGAVHSDNAALFMQSQELVPPSITLQPHNQLVYVGASVTFSVAAAGSAPLTYQWRFNNADLPAETNAIFVIPEVQAAQAGSYSVKVSNPAGVTNSASAVLRVYVSTGGGTVIFNNHVLGASNDAAISFSGDGPAPTGRINGSNAVPDGDYIWGGINARAGLYAGPAGSTEDQLVLLAPIAGFYSGVVAGYIAAGPASSRIVNGVAPGAPAVAQIRVWDAGISGVATYEEAVALAHTRGVYLGKSALINIPALGGAGAPPSFPVTLDGLTAFNVVYTDLGVAPVAAAPLTVQQWAAYSAAVRQRPVQLTLRSNPQNGGAMRLEFQGLMGQKYYIQGSVNMVDWVTIGTVTTAIDGTVTFDDSIATPNRFYRVAIP